MAGLPTVGRHQAPGE